MTSALGPISLSIWDEPGLEIEGFAEPPTAMMGHHRPAYQAGSKPRAMARPRTSSPTRSTSTIGTIPLINRLIAAGERNPRIRIRKVDKSQFNEEARLILNLLNDAWSDNWGFVPLTESEIAYAGKKLKPIIYQRAGTRRRYRRRTGRLHADHPRHQRADPRPQRRAVPVQLVKLLWRLRKPRTRRAARAADGRREEAASHPAWPASSLS